MNIETLLIPEPDGEILYEEVLFDNEELKYPSRVYK